ncbi:fimbria/pilus outer membrane usher protein [Lelliottia sp. V106_10]|uniref:Fimbria/pilus outer membrane usher protein n=2 Tax=Enterobacteriaceae TaxID=543 RepID=A0AAP4D3H6_9ENTR|nr:MULTISPECIES: fimbria/pilus outer membrane usher protein [unclassified Lelliottia]MDK9357488.1 fimbria/pilus outer membrane usher protein [Lelliottia sp. V106_16]MDK9364561.1 fimbria/pilus outer membrane usher protein [Lelliottia sp. V106_12]MDK9373020.1 fimbria/pilus outer membrane usher protein [Lelliottia sp. V106_10]MDK9586445.1 fimbria/pilus outer membrane usher protein [Lelliottia sp. V86_10]MDK9599824.1 fimbria/pilus outer membrane usher protein [Lelliottia sp. V106_5]
MMKQTFSFKPARLALFIAAALGMMTHVVNARDEFNPELLEVDNPGAGKTDLSAFEAGSQAPGTYHVDIVLDEQLMDTRDVDFKGTTDTNGETVLQPCLTLEQLKAWGVKTELFPSLAASGQCVDLAAIPKASADFQFATQRLVISVPQAALVPQARGYVPPEQWDEGINAVMLNYSASGSNNWQRGNNGGSDNSQYANLRPGVNIGPWRLRNYTTWNRDTNGQDKWDTVYTYAQRDVIPLKAQFTAGDSNAPSDIFDSMPFRGAQLASDDDMLPDSLKGYAPVVRGIARTNAQVIIRQNGYQIYQSYVAPGAFEITDMYPTGGAGDLDVTIKEADGSEQHFTVAFASLPVLQREGRFKYALTGGQYRSYDSSVDKTPFGQLTGIYGLSYGVTIYGGVQESSKYQSLASGIGKNLGDFGAFSVDVTQAWSTPKDEIKTSGQSWRARYSKNILDTGTNFAIAGYRYSTSGYYGMQEVLDSYSNNGGVIDRRRNRMELTVSQTLGQDLGSLMLSAVREDYWNSERTMQSYSAGYSNSWRGMNYGLTYTYSKNGSATGNGDQTYYDKDQQLAVNISIPLEKFLPQSWANYSMNASKENGTTHTVGVSGMAMENNALNWNVQQGYGTDDVGYTGSMNADYKGTYGEMTAGYGYDKNSDRVNYGIQGGILAHEDGITFSQPLGETNVLIKAPGAKGVDIQNQTGAKTDWRGYTTVSNLTVYRKNDVALRTDSLPDDVELDLTNKAVIPTRGAVVRADYIASVGMRVLMTITQANGQPVPFGAIATLEGQKTNGFIIGDNGQVYLSGLQQSGRMNIKWGESSQQNCSLSFHLPEQSKGVAMLNEQCQ